MAKRRKQNPDEHFADGAENPIGLTGAFPVIRDPQAVKYDEGDSSIGLTEAFGAVPGDADVPHSWDRAGKWTDFDWDAPLPDDYPGEGGGFEGEGPDGAGEGDSPAEDGAVPGDAGADDRDGRGQDGTPMPADEAPSETGGDDGGAVPSTSAVSTGGTQGRGKHGRHAAPEVELSPRMQKSKRTRRILIVVVVLLVLVIGALGYYMYRTFSASQQEAAQQAQEQAAAPKDNITETEADDTIETAALLADVPNLTSLLGKTTDEAVADLARGAIVTSNRKVSEKGSAIKTEISIALTEEPVDSKTGTPTVYLGLNKKGKVVQVGYSASASALGFGSLSFSDAVLNEHVVEKTLAKIGVDVPEGSAVLPDDKAKYSTYESDGTTVVMERCAFDGDVAVGDVPCEWSAVLSYDYKSQLLSGNLSDTIRIIYVYLTQK